MPANVGLWGGIACLLGYHVRSRGQASAMPEGWVSRCARCAMPMARAHGGGKWQVVKTPKVKKTKAAKHATREMLAKAMSRSRQAGVRKEAKEARAARKAVAMETAPIQPDWPDEADGAEAPARRERGLFRRGRSRNTKKRPKRARRFPFFLKAASIEADTLPEDGNEKI